MSTNHSSETSPSTSRHILIVTVTKVEAQAVMKVFRPSVSGEWPRLTRNGKTYYNLGTHGNAPVVMVQSEMGNATPAGSLLTVRDAIVDWNPQAIIMCGIAFGLKPQKQALGDILVARQLQYYEPEKISQAQLWRGDRTTASDKLIGLFRSADNDYGDDKPKRHFGLVLSGEKLVNNLAFRDQLSNAAPEAIGGEMEGAGLYTAARPTQTEWILVKAICDWADGTKNDEFQATAANNAANFVLYVIERGNWTVSSSTDNTVSRDVPPVTEDQQTLSPAEQPYRYNLKVFISYKKKFSDNPTIAQKIWKELTEAGFEVFLDTRTIEAGVEWDKEIYQNIQNSDVLLLLLEPKASTSDWIQREVDMARGIHINIVPIVVVPEEKMTGKYTLDKVQKRLALFSLQYEYFSGTKAEFQSLIDVLEKRGLETRKLQKSWSQSANDRWRPTPPQRSNKSYYCYCHPEWQDGIKLHLAVGNILDMRNIDVIVNSENNYMQMARYFEQNTISGRLRVEGALKENGQISIDFVQDELNAHVKERFKSTPIPMKQVIATLAGHPESETVSNNKLNARFILHVASVEFGGTTRKAIQPIEKDDDVKILVKNCLRQIDDINKAGGVRSLTLSELNVQVGEYSPIRSVIFPIFGTGHGDRNIHDAVTPMLQAIGDYLYDQKEGKRSSLQHIHLAAYSMDYAKVVDELILKNKFQRLSDCN